MFDFVNTVDLFLCRGVMKERSVCLYDMIHWSSELLVVCPESYSAVSRGREE